MKRYILSSVFLFVLCNFSFSQKEKNDTFSYDELWQQYDSFENIGRPQSALEVAQQILSMAKNSKAYDQQIKAVLKIINCRKYFEEYSDRKNLEFLDSEIVASSFPVKQLLTSIQAEVLYDYYEGYNRLIPQGGAPIDQNISYETIERWDAKSFMVKIISLYKESLSDPEKLKQTPVGLIDKILEKGNAPTDLRPTLYDLLMNRAIDFYKSAFFMVNSPIDASLPAWGDLIIPVEEFIALKFKTNDTLSLDYNLLTSYQALLKFHLDYKMTAALIVADIERLDYFYTKSRKDLNANKYYIQLQGIMDKYPANINSAEAGYKMAELICDEYRPKGSDTTKCYKRLALDMCNEILEKYAGSYGAENCKELKSQIENKTLKLNVEETLMPDIPNMFFIGYRNVGSVAVRIARVDRKYKDSIFHFIYENPNRLHPGLVSLRPIFSRNIKLPLPDDFNDHSVEAEIPPLGFGSYIMMISANEDFSKNENDIQYAFFQVTNMGIIFKEWDSNTLINRLVIVHKKTGKPITGVKVEVLLNLHTPEKKISEYITDSKGEVKIKITKSITYLFILTHGKDIYYYYDYLEYNWIQDKFSYGDYEHTRLYTDRTIYRPGQTVYFKGIMYNNYSDKPSELLKSYETNVNLQGPNGQIIGSQEVTTNEYGSFSGSFLLPNEILTGSCTISNRSDYNYIYVEEYKRPKFEVKVQPLYQTCKLNENIVIEGFAKSYAGIPINNAQIKYQVVREASFPMWWYWWLPSPYSPEKEIMNGMMKTDAEGKFNLTFKALADETISKESNPVFNYTITFEVTDITGETHSVTKTISVGYIAVKGNIGLQEWVPLDEDLTATINTTNLEGNKLNLAGKLIINKYDDSPKLIRVKLWKSPDQHIINPARYDSLFPFDAYSDFNNVIANLKKSPVYIINFDSKNTLQILSDQLKSFNPGRYELVFETVDTFGNKVEIKKNFNFYDKNSKKPDINAFFYVIPVKTQVKPGEKAQLIVGTAAPTADIFQIRTRGFEKSEEMKFELTEGQQLIEFPVTEDDRGGFGLQFFTVIENRIIKEEIFIQVPWSNKKLDIQLVTFKSNLEPGKPETWKLKITGPDKEKVSAELMAGMYDASLDDLTSGHANKWELNIWGDNYINDLDYEFKSFSLAYDNSYNSNFWNRYKSGERKFNSLNNFDYYLYNLGKEKYQLFDEEYFGGYEESVQMASPNDPNSETLIDTVIRNAFNPSVPSYLKNSQKQETANFSNDLRKNFNETAFFYPDLKTNENGEIILNFTTPEALTKWKLMLLAHTQDLKIGQMEEYAITRKDLMVTTNMPRFLRTGDKISFSAKASNLSDKELLGNIEIKLLDPITMNPITASFIKKNTIQPLVLSKGENKSFKWEITIPENTEGVICQLMATTPLSSDGEENYLPVLTDKILVTESLPLYIKQGQTKNFVFEKLVRSKSSGVQNKSLTLEICGNPAWYAVLALPYMMEFPYECSEQLFNRYYANSISSHIVHSDSNMKSVFEKWKKSGEILISPLQKNKELKSLALEETPWLLDGKSNTEQLGKLALLFDEDHMQSELTSVLKKLKQNQFSYGAWPWFSDMVESRYISQYIVSGFGHLKNMGISSLDEIEVGHMINRALNYMDKKIKDDYDYLIENKIILDKNNLGYLQVQYLYARSFFKEESIPDESQKAYEYFLTQAKSYWQGGSLMSKAMLSLALYRLGDQESSQVILRSIKEYATLNEEMGMYFKSNQPSYYWYEAPVETQALIIEAFGELTNDTQTVNDLKMWLLKQKQVQDWKTTVATSEACYALLFRGSNWLEAGKGLTVFVNNIKFDVPDIDKEAGTGYFKYIWNAEQVEPQNGNIRLEKTDQGLAWGALHWQYMEKLDKITPAQTPLKLTKEVYLEKKSNAGQVLEKVTNKTQIRVGDLLKIRIILQVDRDMEFIQMKDMRAGALEPVENLSGPRYQGGLSYYQSIRDASVNFFFDWLPKGTYVFDYSLRVSQEGEFQNGITTIQSMYAPEFNSHSEGIKLKVMGMLPD